jgi:hypothetical protein
MEGSEEEDALEYVTLLGDSVETSNKQFMI